MLIYKDTINQYLHDTAIDCDKIATKNKNKNSGRVKLSNRKLTARKKAKKHVKVL